MMAETVAVDLVTATILEIAVLEDRKEDGQSEEEDGVEEAEDE